MGDFCLDLSGLGQEPVAGSCKNCNETSGSIKWEKGIYEIAEKLSATEERLLRAPRSLYHYKTLTSLNVSLSFQTTNVISFPLSGAKRTEIIQFIAMTTRHDVPHFQSMRT